jgi:acetolactate synthase-1/2/3 large subunit
VREADLLLVVGARLGEMTTQGYTLPEPPRAAAYLAHVHPDGGELGRVYHPDLPIVAQTAAFARAAAALPATTPTPARAARVAEAHAAYERMLTPPPQPGALDMGRFMAALAARLPEDAILCNGAGNYATWVHKFWRFRQWRTQLAPTSGAMGYGLPAAVAACLAHPDRRVVAFAGDGCFQMSASELATIRQHGLRPLIVVVDNGMLGTIRMHQARSYPDAPYATTLQNPDFAALARAHGVHAEWLEDSAAIEATLDRALAADGPALIACRVDPEGITPRATLSGLTAAARAPG